MICDEHCLTQSRTQSETEGHIARGAEYQIAFTTNLEGTLLAELGALGSLTYLSSGFESYSLARSIAASFEYLSRPEVMEVSDNNFVGSLDEGLFLLPLLKRVYFGSNQITAELPSLMDM